MQICQERNSPVTHFSLNSFQGKQWNAESNISIGELIWLKIHSILQWFVEKVKSCVLKSTLKCKYTPNSVIAEVNCDVLFHFCVKILWVLAQTEIEGESIITIVQANNVTILFWSNFWRSLPKNCTSLSQFC